MKTSILFTMGIVLTLPISAGATQLWQKYDIDNDGHLSITELQALETANPKLRGKVILADADTNKDGRISEGELRAAVAGAKVGTTKAISGHGVGTVTVDGNTVNRETHSSGTVTKTENGRLWDADISGSNSKGSSWSGDAHGEVVRDDGTRTITKESTVTRDDGSVVERERESVWTKTEDGWTIESEGSKTTDNGTSIFSGNATVTSNGDGTRTLEGEREGTRANGVDWESTVNGTSRKTEDGREFERTVDGQASNGSTWHRETEGSVTHDRANGTFERESNSTIERQRGEIQERIAAAKAEREERAAKMKVEMTERKAAAQSQRAGEAEIADRMLRGADGRLDRSALSRTSSAKAGAGKSKGSASKSKASAGKSRAGKGGGGGKKR
jgi:hypothetical protein